MAKNLDHSRRVRPGKWRSAPATVLSLAVLCCAGAPAARGWNAVGHRVITLLALDGLPADAPDWLREAAIRERIAYQSHEADRWRGSRMDPIGHENRPDHYLDIELLDQFGLTLRTMPKFRYDYLRTMAVSKHLHPEMVDPYDAARDYDRSKEWPGFLAHAIMEHYAKLEATFRSVRILERLNDPKRKNQLESARANAIYHMGMLSHFVGDAAQPLHTTRHFNGWVGDNPNGYTTSNKFHSYIDGGVARRHKLTYAALKGGVKYDRKVDAADPWNDVLSHIERSFAQMEPLYALEKSGALNKAAGKRLITERLSDGAATLSALYRAAYVSAAPTDAQIKSFVRFDARGEEFKP